jgi:hypothetical protein
VCRYHTRECHINTDTCQNYSRESGNCILHVKPHSACGNHTLREEINVVRVKIALVRIVITFVCVVIILVSVVITFVCVKITMRVEITLCV